MANENGYPASEFTPYLGLSLFAPLGTTWREDASAGELLDANFEILDAKIESLIISGGDVQSVNGKTGVVVLTAANVGADAAGAAAAALSTAEGYTNSAIAALVFPATTAAVAHEWLASYNATTGVFTQTQPSVSDLTSGALANGTTATTQLAGDTSTKIATDAFVETAVAGAEALAAALYIPLSTMTTHGDIIYEDASLGPLRLPIGSTGQVLTVAGGQPAWATPAAIAWAGLTGDLTETQVIPWDGPTVGTSDTSLSRISAGLIGVGTGAQGSHAGSLSMANLTVSGTTSFAAGSIAIAALDRKSVV